MKTKWMPKMPIDIKNMPFKWQERLLNEGKIGGVMLVFIEGISREQVGKKASEVREFCKKLKEKYE